jgi:hypothetical protein
MYSCIGLFSINVTWCDFKIRLAEAVFNKWIDVVLNYNNST